jgi:hypothetical protein
VSILNAELDATSIIADASNVRGGGDEAYTIEDFLAMYPGFGKTSENVDIVPEAVLQVFIDLAVATVQAGRFRGAWALCMGYFVAHFATLWLESNEDPENGAAAVLEAGRARGLITSENVGDVSVSMDYSTIAKDLDGWAAWILTNHGRNLATLAKLYGKGGMVVC